MESEAILVVNRALHKLRFREIQGVIDALAQALQGREGT